MIQTVNFFSLSTNTYNPRNVTYGVDVVEQLSSRGFEHSVHHVTHQILQPVQQILKGHEGTLGLNVSVPVYRKRVNNQNIGGLQTQFQKTKNGLT